MRKNGYQFLWLQGTKTLQKKFSSKELELLSVVWAVDRYKHYLLGTNFIIATDQKAPILALDTNKLRRTSGSRLTRWVDQLLPHQFEIVHIPGKHMGIVDYMSRETNLNMWPESEI